MVISKWENSLPPDQRHKSSSRISYMFILMNLSFYRTYNRLMWPKYAWSLWCRIKQFPMYIYNILYSSTVEVLRRWCLYSSMPLYHRHFIVYSANNLISSSKVHAETATAEERWDYRGRDRPPSPPSPPPITNTSTSSYYYFLITFLLYCFG